MDYTGPTSVILAFLACFTVEKLAHPKPTTHYLDKSEYLPILTANIIADLIIIFIAFSNYLPKSTKLIGWYKKYRLSAMIADILIGVLYMLLARYVIYLFRWNVGLTLFAAIAVAIQVIFDYAFYLFFTAIPRGKNDMLDYFKDYASQQKEGALFGDSFLVILAVIISGILNSHGFNFNIVALILSVYLAPYFIYMKD
jgi:hypothetical protein